MYLKNIYFGFDALTLLSVQLRPLLLGAACLTVTSCISESDKNPFDVSGFSTNGAREPFSSTVYPEPEILTQESPSNFQQATFAGQAQRSVFDGRSKDFVSIDAYVFTITYSDGHTLEAAINSEFGSEASASAEAQRFGWHIGQLPFALRSELQQIWIHKGRTLWGSVNNALYLHTDMTADYEAAGILEETLIHESAHVSLDEPHETSAGWLTAQASDDNFISTYAKENVTTEDVAESFLMWMALRYKSDILSTDNIQRIEEAIPARLSYLDQQGFDMRPVAP